MRSQLPATHGDAGRCLFVAVAAITVIVIGGSCRRATDAEAAPQHENEPGVAAATDNDGLPKTNSSDTLTSGETAPASPRAAAAEETPSRTSLSVDVLQRSLDAGTRFLLHNQTEAGNFHYQYDFVARTDLTDDDAVRQAGALWGLALIHHYRPSDETHKALTAGIAFYERNSRVTSSGRMIVYPGAIFGQTGAQALLTLTLTDAIRSASPGPDVQRWSNLQQECLAFLLSLYRGDGHFHDRYDVDDGVGYSDGTSPYADGEALLALVKTARYIGGRSELQATIEALVEGIENDYVAQPLRREEDSLLTKGCYQWYSLALYELSAITEEAESKQEYVDRTLRLANWVIDVHRILTRTRNTAYAYEGLLCAYDLARRSARPESLKLRRAIESGLRELTQWQVGGPDPNAFLLDHPTTDRRAVGGVMSARDDPALRIDTTQHQMHAVVLALELLADDARSGPTKVSGTVSEMRAGQGRGPWKRPE